MTARKAQIPACLHCMVHRRGVLSFMEAIVFYDWFAWLYFALFALLVLGTWWVIFVRNRHQD